MIWTQKIYFLDRHMEMIVQSTGSRGIWPDNLPWGPEYQTVAIHVHLHGTNIFQIFHSRTLTRKYLYECVKQKTVCLQISLGDTGYREVIK